MQKIKLYSSRKLLFLFVLLALALCIFIFCMSGESAEISGTKSKSIVKEIVTLVVPDFDRRIPPAEQPAFFSTLDHYFRKAAHFSLFALLGVLLFDISVYFEATFRAHVLTAFFGAAVYAAIDEFHQAFSPGRGPRASDVLLDSAGAAFGIFAALMVALWIVKRKRSAPNQMRSGANEKQM